MDDQNVDERLQTTTEWKLEPPETDESDTQEIEESTIYRVCTKGSHVVKWKLLK